MSMLSLVELLGVSADTAIIALLGFQSWILYKLLPEIKTIVKNSTIFNVFKKASKGTEKNE